MTFGQMLTEAREQFITRQSRLRRQRVDLIGAQGAGQIARRNLLVRSGAHPRIGGVAMAALLKLVQEVAEAAADHTARCAACEQAAEAALEQIAEPAAAKCTAESTGQAGIHRRWRGRRIAAGLTAAVMLDRLVCKQGQDRHGHRRHAALGIGVAWSTRTARAVLHAVEYVEQTHGSLLSRASPRQP